ncbi:MAG: protein kinase [Planctomycetes bacterium]|nr:protein kinase [Planctomycetota bacterium]
MTREDSERLCPDVATTLHTNLRKLRPDGATAIPERPDLKTRYVFREEVGRGGMGAVLEVFDNDLRRTLAMKVVNQSEDPQLTEAVLERFLEEAQVTGQLDHPGIVPLHELGVDSEGRVYFTMRLVRGKEYTDVIAAARRDDEQWTRKRALRTLIQVCEATAYAHSKGVIHRDLKPANIMVGRFGEAYVMDWGLAKVLGRADRELQESLATHSIVQTERSSDDPVQTQAGTVFGTPAYMAPEQARGADVDIDHRADVYSVGAILYHLLTGHPPHVPDNASIPASTVLKWLLEGPPKPVREIDPKVPVELAAICEKAMARDRDDRYADLLELAEDLRRFLHKEPVRARPLTAFERLSRWCKQNPVPLALMLAVGAGGGIGLWDLSQLSSRLIRESALDAAERKARTLETVNTLYSSEVVANARSHIEVTHDYANREGAIPLPATFLTELGHAISADRAQMEVRHYSEYPFAFRKDGGLRDEFAHDAWNALHEDASRPFYRFEELHGDPVLRYASARIMKESCISCHNEHPDSTKRDWKVGDVRGVLEVVWPLTADKSRTHAGLARSFTLISGIVVGLMALSLVLLRRRS